MIPKSQTKYIQSLGQKKQRDREGLFVAEGPKLVEELLQSKNVEVLHLYATGDWLQNNQKLLKEVNASAITDAELEKISQLRTPNQVIAVIRKFKDEEPVTGGKVSLLLDTIQDPGNLGTIIRIADWFGVGQIICSHECADLYNSKVVQSTMGSIARVRIFYTDLPAWLKQHNETRVYATMLEGKDITTMSRIQEGLIIIGNEAKGIDRQLLQYASERITIPKKGQGESLNAAVAAGIILAYLV